MFTKATLLSMMMFTAVSAQKLIEDFRKGPPPGPEGWRGSRSGPGVRGKKMGGGEWGDFPMKGPQHNGMMMGPHHHNRDGAMCGPPPFLFHPPQGEDFEDRHHHDGGHDRALYEGHHGHHDGEEHHGPHGMNEAWKPKWDKQFVDRMECGADSTACDLRGDDKGFFVCREFDFIQEGLKKSVCIPSSRGMEGDQCGCCNGVCPEACTLECEMKDEATGEPTGDMGVLVTFSMPECDPFNMCVPADLSLKMVSHRPFGMCATETLEPVYYVQGREASLEQENFDELMEESVEEDVEARDSV